MIAGIVLVVIGLAIGGFGYYASQSVICLMDTCICNPDSEQWVGWFYKLLGGHYENLFSSKELVVQQSTLSTVTIIMMVIGGLFFFLGAYRIFRRFS